MRRQHKALAPLITLLIVLANIFEAAGQSSRTNISNQNLWLMYFGNHKFSARTGMHAEVQFRRNEFVSNQQQLLLRAGIDFYSKGNNRFTLGYAFVRTYPYGEFAVAKAFPEHRIWQQFLTTQSLGKIKLAHRYRLEQRMLGNSTTGKFADGRYENRMRYMAKITRNIAGGEKPVFLSAYDEIFLNFGSEVGYNIFDQNRLYAAIGFTLSPSLKLEVGYLHQLVQLRSLDLSGTPKNRIENNHTFQVGFYHNMSFFTMEEKD